MTAREIGTVLTVVADSIMLMLLKVIVYSLCGLVFVGIGASAVFGVVQLAQVVARLVG